MDIAQILSRRYGSRVYSLNSNDYEGLVWLDDTPKPSEVMFDRLWPGVRNEIATEKDALGLACCGLMGCTHETF